MVGVSAFFPFVRDGVTGSVPWVRYCSVDSVDESGAVCVVFSRNLGGVVVGFREYCDLRRVCAGAFAGAVSCYLGVGMWRALGVICVPVEWCWC